MDQLPLPLPFCSIRIQYSGVAGSVEAEVSSVEENTNTVVDARVENEGDGWAGSGANPWHLDAQTESILFLTNESDKAARIGFSITAGGVHYYLTMLKLSPHETRAIDLRKLRYAQISDLRGNRIPAGATDGSVNWVRLDKVPVMGRLMVIERHKGIAASYDCGACPCPNSFISVGVSPVTVAMEVGSAYSCWATAQYQDCNSNQYYSDVTSDSTWSSNNTYVATVDTVGDVTGDAPGSASISATYSDCGYDQNCYCTTDSSTGGCTANAYTHVQHNYPNNPFGSVPCWVSQFFDHVSVVTGRPHQAEDTVKYNGNGGGVDPSLGDPVYAAEGGTVVYPTSSSPVYGPASPGYPNCGSHNANYVKIKGSDGYFTVYVHVSPSVTDGPTVNAGQPIGTVDNSGCESGPHVHVQRGDANDTKYNFTLPCTNPTPTKCFWDGLVDDIDNDY